MKNERSFQELSKLKNTYQKKISVSMYYFTIITGQFARLATL